MLRSMIIVGLVGLIGLPCLAQSGSSSPENKPSPQSAERASKTFYQLSFVIKEVENERVINTRSYSMIVQGMEQSSIRAGEKVPFSSTSGANTEWQQINVGVNIDCKQLEVTGNRASLDIKAEISSVMESSKADSPPPSLPIIRNNQWESKVVVPVKQASVLFSSDDTASKRTMRLELTVTPIL
jgi:hypothetical protein